MNRMDLNSTHSCDFSYHNITRSQISIDKYNGESKRINIPEKISGQEVVEIGEKAFSNNLIIEHIQLPDSNAFVECESLQNIQICSERDYIGTNTFAIKGWICIGTPRGVKECYWKFSICGTDERCY